MFDMSILTDFRNMLDKRSLGGIATALGEPEGTISRGMQTIVPTILGGVAAKSESPGFLQSLFDMMPAGGSDTSWSNIASATGAGSPLMSAGTRMLPQLFGNNEHAVTQTLARETGIGHGVTSSLMAMAAPMVMGYLGRRMRDGGMTLGGVGSLLQREIPAIQAALPASLVGLLWPHERAAVSSGPVIEQTVRREATPGRFVLPLVLLALLSGLIWMFSHGRRVNAPVVPMPNGSANRVVTETPVTPSAPLPSLVVLYFNTGSATLRPDSQARLDQFADAVKGNRHVHVTVNGYTDNVGKADSNLRLSQSRADTIASNLESKGVPADIVTAKGYGADDPAADNATAAGRANNRRVSVAAEAY
jgi:outer membrane protein OmpA-like peptidoglycan-associated protein